MRGQAFPTLSIVLAALALAGCAAAPPERSESRLFGLRPGPLPTPQPFVIDSRAAAPQGYPLIGAAPPPRRDRILTLSERKALEDDLKRHQDKAAMRRPPVKRKKPAVPVT